MGHISKSSASCQTGVHAHLLVAVHLGLQAGIARAAGIAQCTRPQRAPAPLWGVEWILALRVAAHAPRGPHGARHHHLVMLVVVGRGNMLRQHPGVWLGHHHPHLPVRQHGRSSSSTHSGRWRLVTASARKRGAAAAGHLPHQHDPMQARHSRFNLCGVNQHLVSHPGRLLGTALGACFLRRHCGHAGCYSLLTWGRRHAMGVREQQLGTALCFACAVCRSCARSKGKEHAATTLVP